MNKEPKTDSVVELMKPCKTHKHILSKMGYLQAHREAERRLKRGQKQKQCPDCKHWYFKDEM